VLVAWGVSKVATPLPPVPLDAAGDDDAGLDHVCRRPFCDRQVRGRRPCVLPRRLHVQCHQRPAAGERGGSADSDSTVCLVPPSPSRTPSYSQAGLSRSQSQPDPAISKGAPFGAAGTAAAVVQPSGSGGSSEGGRDLEAGSTDPQAPSGSPLLVAPTPGTSSAHPAMPMPLHVHVPLGSREASASGGFPVSTPGGHVVDLPQTLTAAGTPMVGRGTLPTPAFDLESPRRSGSLGSGSPTVGGQAVHRR
jgi:hypothetical protein